MSEPSFPACCRSTRQAAIRRQDRSCVSSASPTRRLRKSPTIHRIVMYHVKGESKDTNYVRRQLGTDAEGRGLHFRQSPWRSASSPALKQQHVYGSNRLFRFIIISPSASTSTASPFSSSLSHSAPPSPPTPLQSSSARQEDQEVTLVSPASMADATSDAINNANEKGTLTIPGHAEVEALLQAAVLASVAVDPIHHAVLLARALVVDDGGLGPPEEALAALARDDTIVDAGGLVAAHLAGNDLNLGCGRRARARSLVLESRREGRRGRGRKSRTSHYHSPLPPPPPLLPTHTFQRPLHRLARLLQPFHITRTSHSSIGFLASSRPSRVTPIAALKQYLVTRPTRISFPIQQSALILRSYNFTRPVSPCDVIIELRATLGSAMTSPLTRTNQSQVSQASRAMNPASHLLRLGE
ncbi:hypothetical protein C7M84_012088 [Penaeus vannamei]|uniref:Uncharacterized protein n=1 Tax=Penaeus vannamei TaxID=6689 RepID=A0A3R7M246_PENVA|nr:hypothetical protein C7M84_012088 [Penaeus vannamei]